jgi:hypothetical protein
MADSRFLDPITILADIGGISIDVTDRLEEDHDSIVTENPIEDGSPTTDHITLLPIVINIEGGFSDLVMTNLTGPALTNDALKGRAKTQFDRLKQLQINRDTFYVMDGFHLIQNMVLKRLTLRKDKEGFFLNFSAELRQIHKVTIDKRVAGYDKGTTVASDAYDRKKMTTQLLLSVGTISTQSSLQSVGILA